MTTTLFANLDPTSYTGYNTIQETNAAYSVAFTVAKAGTLKNIGFWSPDLATSTLPLTVGLFEEGNTTAIAEATAVWSGAHGTGWLWSPITDTDLVTGQIYLAVVATEEPNAFDQAYLFPGDAVVPRTSTDSNITNPATMTNGDPTSPYQNGGGFTYPETAAPGAFSWLIDVEIDFGSDPPPDDTFNITEGSTSGGITSYSVDATINSTGDSGPQTMRVLTPDSPAAGRAHGILWMLPVEPGQGTTFGDPLDHAKTLGIHNTYNLTCVQPGFPLDPWYMNHATDHQTQQETFMLQLVDWANSNIAPSGTEKHYLIGFSKSGFGGQVLFMRNQDVFAKVASWDAATDYATLSQYDGDAVAGTQGQLDTYKLFDPNLSGWVDGGNLKTENRIWLGAGIDLIDATSDYSDRLTTDLCLHKYVFAETAAHNWATTPDWVAPAVQFMLDEPVSMRSIMGFTLI